MRFQKAEALNLRSPIPVRQTDKRRETLSARRCSLVDVTGQQRCVLVFFPSTDVKLQSSPTSPGGDDCGCAEEVLIANPHRKDLVT